MSETVTKHTPGPWFLEVTSTRLWVGVEKAAGGKVGDIITSVEGGEDYTLEHNDRALANARLIAAAPELLDALEWAMSMIHEPRLIRGQNDAHYSRWQSASAAIAKATGGA